VIISIGDIYNFTELDIRKLKKEELIYIEDDNSAIFKIKKKLRDNRKGIYIILNQYHISLSLRNFLKEINNNAHVETLFIDEFLEKYLNKIYLDHNFMKYIYKDIKPFSKVQYFQKRTIDYLIIFPLVILSSPIIFYSIIKIQKESPDDSPMFYQIRIKKNNKPFICFKFRSMRTDINFFNHYTQDNDPRIFNYGKFMRKTRIDELPQIINVIKGDMHIVGPRAEWYQLVKKYLKVYPCYKIRHIVNPGITGWAQIHYPYGRDLKDTKQKLMYDLYYIKNWSLWLEIKIIVKTIWIMFRAKGL